MNTPDLQRNAKMLLKLASTECKEMHYDLKEDAILPDMDAIYSSAEEMRRCADRLNLLADKLMIEYRNMEHHKYCVKELHKMLGESYAH